MQDRISRQNFSQQTDKTQGHARAVIEIAFYMYDLGKLSTLEESQAVGLLWLIETVHLNQYALKLFDPLESFIFVMEQVIALAGLGHCNLVDCMNIWPSGASLSPCFDLE